MLASRGKQNTSSDYLLASRDIHPVFAALAGIATNASGFMFIGLIGETYTKGLSSIWIMIGWIVGDYIMWHSGIHQALRKKSEETNTETIGGFISHGLKNKRLVSASIAIITVIFLGTYAAAQLKAGSKALHVIFGWHDYAGAIIGAIIVTIYCFAGGIRASIWTNVAQSFVMMLSMGIIMTTALIACGGFGGLWETLRQIDPSLLSFNPTDSTTAFIFFVLGWLAAGMGVVGQPHIMVCVMTVRSEKDIAATRTIYFIWYVLFTASAIMVGLCARALLPMTAGFDAELALPVIAQKLLPDVLIGFTLAGLFAATMSTADSQILSCSAAITQDLVPKWSRSVKALKASTLTVSSVVLIIALLGNSVFTMVVFSWSVLAASIGPLVILRCLGAPLTGPIAMATSMTGLVTVILWRSVLQWSGNVYEVLPGMVASFVVYEICRRIFQITHDIAEKSANASQGLSANRA